ncbi:hypothetical protein D3C71_1695390 [compost metagenome]
MLRQILRDVLEIILITKNGYIFFNKEDCEDCKHWAEAWDDEINWNKINAPYLNNYKSFETQKVKLRDGKLIIDFNLRLVKDPRKEKTKDFRKNNGCRRPYRKEKSCLKKYINRRFKTKIKDINKEEYINIRPRDYRTYGRVSY